MLMMLAQNLSSKVVSTFNALFSGDFEATSFTVSICARFPLFLTFFDEAALHPAIPYGVADRL